MTALLLLALALYEPPASATVERGLPHVESRNNALAVSWRGARGRWQVMPRYARMLRRWQKRCRGDARCALRAYACGNRALRDERACGRYAAAVMAAGGGK
jgi:hypothetical protein